MILSDEQFQYLESLHAGDSIASRVQDLLPVFEWMSPEAIERLFVADRIDPTTGDRQFDSLWAFSASFMLESKNFLVNANADVVPLKNAITRIEVDLLDYDFRGRPRKGARLSVDISIAHQISGKLAASGTNCSYLATIVREVLVPNMRTSKDPLDE